MGAPEKQSTWETIVNAMNANEMRFAVGIGKGASWIMNGHFPGEPEPRNPPDGWELLPRGLGALVVGSIAAGFGLATAAVALPARGLWQGVKAAGRGLKYLVAKKSGSVGTTLKSTPVAAPNKQSSDQRRAVAAAAAALETQQYKLWEKDAIAALQVLGTNAPNATQSTPPSSLQRSKTGSVSIKQGDITESYHADGSRNTTL